MRSVSFNVPIVFSKERPRRARGGHFYTPRSTQMGEDLVAWHTRKNVHGTFTGPVELILTFTTKRRLDLDNAIKGILDGLEKGGAFANDRQVRHMDAEIHEGEPEDTRITIAEIRGVSSSDGPERTAA